MGYSYKSKGPSKHIFDFAKWTDNVSGLSLKDEEHLEFSKFLFVFFSTFYLTFFNNFKRQMQMSKLRLKPVNAWIMQQLKCLKIIASQHLSNI